MLRRSFLVFSVLIVLAGPASPVIAQQARLDPNTATRDELAALSSLDSSLAEEIVANRPFPTMVEFDALVGASLSQEDASKLYEQLFIPINLNTASEAEIALIPGMSRRMIREFLEYRPYADLSVFDREIGKYVDETEVARLRSYVKL